MFDLFQSFFQKLGGDDTSAKLDRDDPRVAATALLYHIMDSDGERREEEKKRLNELLSQTYKLEGNELKELMLAGEEADRESVDLFRFTHVLKRELNENERLEFIEIMWEIVFADGVIHELEDNTIWRVADLIGVGNRDRVLLRRKVADKRGVSIFPQSVADNS